MIVVLLVLAFVVFCLQRYTPADPVRVKLGAQRAPAMVKAERHRLGYDRPLLVQYVDYVKGLAHGDLQDSLRTRHPVTTDLGNYVPATLELTGFALGLALVLGTLLGDRVGRAHAGLGGVARRDGRRLVRAGVPARAARPAALLPAARLAARDRAHEVSRTADRADEAADDRQPRARPARRVHRRGASPDPARRSASRSVPRCRSGACCAAAS